MSIKRRRKVERRNARTRKSASRIKAARHAELGDSPRALPHRDSVKLSDLLTMRAFNERGPGEELAYDYSAGDHGWFVTPRAGEPFELPLTGELESSWGLLAEQDPACAPVSERIRSLRAAGRTHVMATLTSVFWEVLLPDGSTVCLESASDDEPASVSSPELADRSVGFWASELGLSVSTVRWPSGVHVDDGPQSASGRASKARRRALDGRLPGAFLRRRGR